MDAAWGLVAGTGWSSGVNLYAAVLLLGVMGRVGGAEEVPDLLTRREVMAVAAVMYAFEFVIDKVPFLDNVWDAVHTVVRPVGAAVISGALAHEADLATAAGALTGGGLSFAAHATKATLRLAVNTSPEPASNILVSLFEDVLVAGTVYLAVEHPLIAAAVVVLLLVASGFALVLAFRLIRAGFRRVRQRFRGVRLLRRSSAQPH